MGHVWELERPVYDVRTDSYWLVTGDGTSYRFSGPVKPSEKLLILLPSLTQAERRDVMAHLPTLVGLNTYVARDFARSSEDAESALDPWTLCKEAVVLFDRFRSDFANRSEDQVKKLPRPELCNYSQGYRGVYSVGFSVDPLDLPRPLTWFVDHYLTWAMGELAHTVPSGDHTYVSLELPQGTIAAVQENHNGVFLRLVVDNVPVSKKDNDLGIVHEVRRYYDVSTDEYKVGPTALVMHFSVRIDA